MAVGTHSVNAHHPYMGFQQIVSLALVPDDRYTNRALEFLDHSCSRPDRASIQGIHCR